MLDARRAIRWAAVAPVVSYRMLVSPWLPRSCRFEPICSAYAVEAVLEHGIARGAWLALRRLARCRPACASGYDPVPAKS